MTVRAYWRYCPACDVIGLEATPRCWCCGNTAVEDCAGPFGPQRQIRGLDELHEAMHR